ncbi:fumarylacetoacetate hydrolase family protein [Micromonospora sp. NPDC050397]|uniref:fumarylacetoacetate hydrolase family protein n=1 Tax=Micromonospora sp. NPDC050397 TaxID=3364279 RepID=UPI00384E0AF4
MKLLRVGPPGGERPAVLAEDGTLLDLSGAITDFDGDFLADGGINRVRGLLELDLPPLRGRGLRIGPPLRRPGKIVCVGLNYHDHARETGVTPPAEPVLFLKAPDTVVGACDEVLVPHGGDKTDWEIELAVVIGRTARYLSPADDALEYVAGYAISHDVSERGFQLERGGQWDKGKSCETFNPFGPWLVTRDEIPDPGHLGLRLWVNGTLRQNGNTKDMIFDVPEIIRYVSQFMTLYPGDIVNTGTPAGVALGMPDPKPYLRPGDLVELEIDGLGRQRQRLGVAW